MNNIERPRVKSLSMIPTLENLSSAEAIAKRVYGNEDKATNTQLYAIMAHPHAMRPTFALALKHYHSDLSLEERAAKMYPDDAEMQRNFILAHKRFLERFGITDEILVEEGRY